jgi:hypothetical protein
MAFAAPLRCSAVAEQLGEAMIGSVDQRVRWLLVEDRSPWGERAVRQLLGADLESAAKARGVRLLLVRRREGDPAADAVRRVFLVDTESREMAVRTVTEVAEIPALLDMAPAEFGAPLRDPLLLVCTNGKRDACCALRGRAVVTALTERHAERTWECTHLGGHRFAGNLVCLPHGLVYGRVSASDAARIADRYLAGRVDAALLRGRSAWPAPAQVAEAALRIRLGLEGVDDIVLEAASLSGDGASVVLRAGSELHRLELVAEPATPPRPISCRADELETPLHWRLVSG